MSTGVAAANADTAVRPFHAEIADEAIADLRRRVAAWRPPEREPVDDQSQGVQLATVKGPRDLLGHRLRLAQMRGKPEHAAAVHHRDRQTRESGRRQHPPKLSAGLDAQLFEHLVQVPFDCAWTDEQSRSNLQIRQPLAGEPRDLHLMGR